MIDTRTLFRRIYPSGARTRYVSASGSDSTGTGTNTNPFATVGKALAAWNAGDRIVVGAGTYDYALVYGVTGQPGAWITIEAAPGTTPVIDVSNSVASYDSTKRNNGLDVQQSSYVGIYGLEIRGNQNSSDTNPSGLGIFRASHHIAVWGCDIHDFPGGGINCFYIAAGTNPNDGTTLPGGGWDCVDVWFNKIHATSRYNPYNTSGISFYGAVDCGMSLPGGYGYRAVGNYIYDVVCTVPYTPGGFNAPTDGNGISPDSLAVANNLYPDLVPYLKRGLLEGNVITSCGGRGIHIYNTKNVDVWHNTLVGNLRTNSPYINGSTEVDLQLDTADPNNGVTIRGNVLLPLNTPKSIDIAAQTVIGNVVLAGTDTVTTGNTDGRAVGASWFRTAPTSALIAAGMPLAALAPAAQPAQVSHPVGAIGYTTIGGRTTAQWSPGALELASAKVFR